MEDKQYTQVVTQPRWNQRLEQLHVDLLAQHTMAINFLKYLEETCATSVELQDAAHLILGLQIALDAMTNDYSLPESIK